MKQMDTREPPRFSGVFGKFGKARDGIAAVEFAMILPIMLTMWLGTTEIGQAIAVSRKVVLVARTCADLPARATSVNNAGMTNIMDATTAVLAPFPMTNLGLVVTSIKRNGSNQNLVVWSDARGPGVSAKPVGSAVALPPGILTAPNQTVILCESRYPYTPIVAWFLSGGWIIDEHTYFVPRLVAEVARVP